MMLPSRNLFLVSGPRRLERSLGPRLLETAMTGSNGGPTAGQDPQSQRGGGGVPTWSPGCAMAPVLPVRVLLSVLQPPLSPTLQPSSTTSSPPVVVGG